MQGDGGDMGNMGNMGEEGTAVKRQEQCRQRDGRQRDEGRVKEEQGTDFRRSDNIGMGTRGKLPIDKAVKSFL